MQNGNDRPPYIRFETRAVEDRARSITSGKYETKDVDYVILMRPGSRDTVEKLATDFLSDWHRKAMDNQIPNSWYAEAKQGYEMWKSGQELPTSGTPIKGWPVLSPSQQQNLLNAGIRSVEDLASLPDGSLHMVGIGGMDMKRKAAAWLAEAQAKGALTQQNAALQAQIDALVENNRVMAAELAALKPTAETKLKPNPFLKQTNGPNPS